MGKKQVRYCVKPRDGNWNVWDRKLKKWWGQPFKDIPEDILNKLNSGNRSEVGSPWKKD